jgi:protein involved in polysaccharide export with SLBB domain
MALRSRGVVACVRSFVFVPVMLALVMAPLRGQSDPVPDADRLTLHPGDMVAVEIWREADLSGAFRVDERGIVTLPLLGEREVIGIPIQELRDRLIEEYRAELRNPSITITPLRQVHVLGHVNSPGMYSVDPTVSLAGAIALAGGASGDGDLRKLRIARAGTIIHDGVAAEATLQQIDLRSGDQIFVDRRAWFERNTTFVISALMSLTSIVISFTR